MRARLATKITVLIVVVLIIGFGASTILTIQREAQLLLDQNKLAVRRLTATLVASIEGAMLQERPDVTRTVLDELKASSPVEELTIYRRNGVEAFTDLTTMMEVNKNAGLAKDVMDNIKKMARAPGKTMAGPLFQQAIATLKPQENLIEENGVPYFVLHQPILNQNKCQGCHGSDHQVRAVVRVATSMAPVMAEVRTQRNRQALVGLLTIVAAGAVMTVAMSRIVIRPINELAIAARRVGQGDFDARACVDSRDELGQLGTAFNEMTDRLAQAYRDLEGKNRELASALQEVHESRQRLALLEQLKGELAKFVPDAVKKLLEQNPNATELEKKTVDVAVLFLDIAGYTKLSEQLEPKKLNQLVQLYFSSFLEIIQAHHGDVNETAGDGLMVVFQADRTTGDHSVNATRAAFAIRQRVGTLNEEYGGVFPAIQLHMGINSGEALVGATKLGGAGSERWTFTASGPTTNIAARLAGSATVEVNSSYYAIPDPLNARRWAERTPPGFIFHVKAYALMTGHHPRPQTLPADVLRWLPDNARRTRRDEIASEAFPPEAIDATFRLFHAALAPLADAGKLGYVLFQFAPWVRFSEARLEQIASLPGRLPGFRVAVEFRDRSWFPGHAAETLTALTAARIAHVVVDAPSTVNAIPFVRAVTARTAVLRLHGRHAEGWMRQLRGEEPSVREKYDYLYSQEELRQLLPDVEELASEAEEVFISFNNNNRDYPVKNALMMRRLLGQPISDEPGSLPFLDSER